MAGRGGCLLIKKQQPALCIAVECKERYDRLPSAGEKFPTVSQFLLLLFFYTPVSLIDLA